MATSSLRVAAAATGSAGVETGITSTKDDFLKWLPTIAGGQVHPDLTVSSGKRGRGIFAKAPIAKGQLLISVPVSHCIGPFHASAKQAKAAGASNLICTVVALIREACDESNSTVARYIADLPDSFDQPTWWTDLERKLLNGTAAEFSGSESKDLESTFESLVLPLLSDCNVTDKQLERFICERISDDTKRVKLDSNPKDQLRLLPLFKWAVSCISSRAFHTGPDGFGPTLVPVVDLLNHSSIESELDTHVETTQGEGGKVNGFQMLAKKDVVAGQELVQSYGSALSDCELLMSYGFTLGIKGRTESASVRPCNILEIVDLLFGEDGEVDSELRARAMTAAEPLWRDKSDGGIPVTAQDLMPPRLSTALHIACFSEEDLSDFIQSPCTLPPPSVPNGTDPDADELMELYSNFHVLAMKVVEHTKGQLSTHDITDTKFDSCDQARKAMVQVLKDGALSVLSQMQGTMRQTIVEIAMWGAQDEDDEDEDDDDDDDDEEEENDEDDDE